MKKILSITAFFLIFMALPVHAKENFLERQSEIRPTMMAKACEMLENRIAEKITNFDNTHQFHVRQYNLMKEKIQKVITQKEAAGVDASKLKADMLTFEELIKKFDADRQAFIDALKNTQQFACGQSAGSFKDVLQTAQEKHRQVLADAKEIRNFYKNTIRPDLKALRD